MKSWKAEGFFLKWMRIVGVLRPLNSSVHPTKNQLNLDPSPSVPLHLSTSFQPFQGFQGPGFSHLWHGRETQASIQLIPSGLNLMEAAKVPKCGDSMVIV